jgi:hypothetical protein
LSQIVVTTARNRCPDSPPSSGHDLQQQVAELLAQRTQIVALDRVGNLVRLLDGVRGDRREGLLHVPGAAALRVTESRHYFEQILDRFHKVLIGL